MACEDLGRSCPDLSHRMCPVTKNWKSCMTDKRRIHGNPRASRSYLRVPYEIVCVLRAACLLSQRGAPPFYAPVGVKAGNTWRGLWALFALLACGSALPILASAATSEVLAPNGKARIVSSAYAAHIVSGASAPSSADAATSPPLLRRRTKRRHKHASASGADEARTRI
eukprot:3269721-Pleurochrysis_carterae.AAC.1